jgi:hypothetical protein
VPSGNCPVDDAPPDLEIIGLSNVAELSDIIF